MGFFNKRMCFRKFLEQQKKFWKQFFDVVVEIVFKKFTFWGGEGVNANLEKV